MVNQPKPNQFMDSSSCMILAYLFGKDFMLIFGRGRIIK